MANKHFQFLRSASGYTSFDAAKNALSKKTLLSGEPALAYYTEGDKKKALLAIGGKESGQIYFYNSDKIEELIAAAKNSVDGRINALNLTSVGGTDKVITTISQENGQVSATAIDLTAANVAYNGGRSILSASTEVKGALEKLETAVLNNKAAELTYKTIKLTDEEVATLEDAANVKEAYKTVSVAKGGTQTTVGDVIKVYKDSSLKSANFVGEDGESKKGQFLKLTYILADGSESVVYVDMSTLIEEAEVENGIQVNNHKLSIKLDGTNESKFLTVGAGGLKLSGVQSAIDAALTSGKTYTNNSIANLDATVSGKSTYSTVKIDESNGILTAVTITDTIGDVSANKAGYAEATNVKAYVDAQVSSKNVGAAGETGDTALITAEANDNTVTVTSTQKLKDAVNRAENAVLSVGKSTSVESYVSLSVIDGDNVTISIDDTKLSTKIAALEGDENSTSGDTSIRGAKKYAEAIVANKNVGAAGETGDTALISASTENNTVIVTSTQKLKDAVTAAETALQKVNGTKNQITVTTKASGEQTISFAEDAIWDCGTF